MINRKIKIKAHYLFLVIVLIINTILNIITMDTDIAQKSIINGLGIIIIGFYIAFYGDKKFDIFSPAFFIGISFVLFYGFSAIIPFFQSGDTYFARQLKPLLPYYPLASLLTFYGAISFLIGYKLNIAQFNTKNNYLFVWDITPKKTKIIWFFFMSLGVLAFLLLIKNNAYLQTTTEMQSPLFYSIIGFIQPGLIFSLSISYIAKVYYNSKFWKYAFLLNLLIFLSFGIPSGSKTLFLIPIIIVALNYNYIKSQISKKQAVVAVSLLLLFVAILMPFNSIYRSLLLSGGSNNNQSISESSEVIVVAVDKMINDDFEKTSTLAIDYMAARLSNVSVTAKILQYQNTPDSIIHWGGSYIRLFYLAIPRFLYPDKPSITIGRIIAVELGYAEPTGMLLGEKAAIVSIGITMVGELVYNFSILAPFGMLFLGVLYKWIYGLFIQNYIQSPLSAIPIYSIIWYMVIFTGGGSNFAAVWAGLIKYIIFIILLFSILKIHKIKRSKI